MSRFRQVLKNRNFFFLWFGQVISQLGDRLDQMALIGFIYARTQGGAGSTLGIAKILSFTIIPVFLIGPIAGVYVDRWDRRRTMYVCDFLRAILVFTIPFFLFYAKNLTPIYLIIFVVFCLGRFYVPAKMSIIPYLVEDKDLLLANSLVNTTGMIAAVIGFGIGGIIVEWFGAKSGFYLDALSFLISAAFIFSISRCARCAPLKISKVGKEIAEVITKSVLAEVKDGILYFIRNKDIRFISGIIFTLWSALGAVYVVLIVFVQKTLHSATKDLGLLIMFLGAGLFLGSLIYGRFGQRLSHYKTIFSSLLASGLMLIFFAIAIQKYQDFFVAAALSFSLGLVVSPIMIASNTIIHNASANNMMGKIFSSLEIVMHLAFLLFMFVSSILAEKFSHGLVLVIVGCIFSAVGFFSLIYNRKIAWLNIFIPAVIFTSAAGVLTGLASSAYAKTEVQLKDEKDGSLREVMPEGMDFEAVKLNGEAIYYKAYDKDKKFIGVVFQASEKGYASEIVTLAGMTKEGVITAIKILAQKETPWVGGKVVKPAFTGRFSGKNIGDLKEIDAITGATVSSRAVISSVEKKEKRKRKLKKKQKKKLRKMVNLYWSWVMM